MAQADLIKSLLDGSAPKSHRLLAARGLVPLAPREALGLLISLAKDPDPQIASHAALTLKSFPEDEVLALVQSRECDAALLEYFARAGNADAVLEAIVLNPSTPGRAVAALSSVASAPLLETILYNKVRLLEFPEILEAVKQNPSGTGEIRRLVQEVEREFFGGKKKDYTVGDAEAAGPLSEAEPVVNLEAEAIPDDLALEGLPLDPEERESAISERLSRMTVPQKIRLALMGTRELRAILIRDPNREVARTVIQSPKLSESEVQAFTAMRSVTEEVLREIGNSRAWTKNYVVVQNLVKNPKTPPGISQRLIFRLQSKDLMLLAKDRTVPESVRQNAQRTIKQRTGSRNL